MPDIEVIPFLVTLGHPGDGTFNLRFPPEYREEVEALLDENGIDHGTIVELSAGTELAIEAVRVLGAAGGLAALASVINTFVRKNDGKRIALSDDGDITEIAGYSDKKVEKFLKDQAERQAQLDLRWKKMVDRELGDQDSRNDDPESPRHHEQ